MKLKMTLIFLFISILSCTFLDSYKTKPRAKPAPTQKTKDFSRIKNNRKDSLNKKIESLKKFIKENEDNNLALKAYLYMARLYYKQNKKREACNTYNKALNLPFSYRDQNKAVFAFAKCLKNAGKLEEALNLLNYRLSNPKETLKSKKEMALMQWRFIENKSNLKKWKLKALSHLILFNANSKKLNTYKKKAKALLENLTSSELLNIVKYANKYGVLEGHILFLAGQLKWGSQDFSTAKSYFEKSLETISNPTIEKKIRHHLRTLKVQNKVNPERIGVILPLSGKRKNLGRKILRGLQTGLGLTKKSSYQLIIMDSKNHPDVTRDAVDKLLYNHYVIAIVGGLSGETAEVIANRATELGVPSILLSQKANLTKDRNFVFQNAITSKMITAQLTKSLFKKTSMKKFAVLHPEDSYGEEYKNLFTKEVRKHGGRIVGVHSYKPDETDFKEPIKKLIGLYDLKKRKEEYEKAKKSYLKKHSFIRSRSKKLRPENLLEPIIEFDGLFIPDSIGMLKKIVAHLKYFGIKNMNLIGNNLWKTSDVNLWAKNFSLFFINTPVISSKEKKVSIFYALYRKQFRSSPGFFERQAFNSGLALKKALSKGSKNRIDLRENLQNLEILSGAFFSFKIAQDRVFTYPLQVYSSKKDKTFSLDSIPVK